LKPIKGYEDAQERKVQGKTLKLKKIRDGFRKYEFPMSKNIREDSLKEIFPQIKSHFPFAFISKDWEQDVERVCERVGESAKHTVSMKQLREMCDKQIIVEKKQSIGWATEMSFNDANPTMCDFDGLPFEELDFEEFSKIKDEINLTFSAGGVN